MDYFSQMQHLTAPMSSGTTPAGQMSALPSYTSGSTGSNMATSHVTGLEDMSAQMAQYGSSVPYGRGATPVDTDCIDYKDTSTWPKMSSL